MTGGVILVNATNYPSELQGLYICGDLVTGEMWSVEMDTARRRVQQLGNFNGGGPFLPYGTGPLSFTQSEADGWIYACDIGAGKIKRLRITQRAAPAANTYIPLGAADLTTSSPLQYQTVGPRTVVAFGPPENGIVINRGGAVTYSTQIDVRADFSVGFQVNFSATNGNDGAAFFLHNSYIGVNAYGSYGTGLGALGLDASLIVGLDTSAAPSQKRLRATSGANGLVLDRAKVSLGANLKDGNWHAVVVSWVAGTTKTLTVTLDGATIYTEVLDGNAGRPDLELAILGSRYAWFGVSGGTSNLNGSISVRPGTPSPVTFRP